MIINAVRYIFPGLTSTYFWRSHEVNQATFMILDTRAGHPFFIWSGNNIWRQVPHCWYSLCNTSTCNVWTRKAFISNQFLDADSTLASFIGQRSWLLFHLLGQDRAWLQFPICEWNINDNYKTMSAIISDLAVVNDTAEKSIKM